MLKKNILFIFSFKKEKAFRLLLLSKTYLSNFTRYSVVFSSSLFLPVT